MAEILVSEDAVQGQSPGVPMAVNFVSEDAIHEEILEDAAQEQSPGDAVQEQSLEHAANEGNIDELYSLIGEDAFVLDNIDAIPFVDTPLHIAASKGHTLFAIEIMMLKPSFARKLNKNGDAPIHLALQNKQTKVVRRLVQVDKDLIRFKGRESLTPLHYAVQNEDIDLLEEFLDACPESIIDMTSRKNSVLHTAVQYNRPKAWECLLKRLRSDESKDADLWETTVMNQRNEEGNTALEMAKNKFLVKEKKNRGIRGRLGSFSGPKSDVSGSFCDPSDVRSAKKDQREFSQITDAARGTLLVIFTLFFTISFQTTLTPPGGNWQDDYLCPTNDPSSCAAKPSHRAGTAIMGIGPFKALTVFNAINFFYTFLAVSALLPGGYITLICRIPLWCLAAYFMISISFTYPTPRVLPSKIFFPILGCILYVFSVTAFGQLLVENKLKELRSQKRRGNLSTN